ncbi:type VII secretion integral membrane protein EccD [Dactylosporangium sp. NPDC005572]|uniref:type VII secretion integral membrane protein EccD n=1 Tax=Dactylosporangium sp. NPDC005572 TaxID=3156889 RepID=UPI0033AED950
MTAVVSGEMCRLVVCGPQRQVELAVPTHVLVADMLPTLLHHLGEELADTSLRHGGWVLQRLGATPFDEEATIAALGLRDGDTVHLRPRAEQIPPPDFDDLLDGVATGLRDRTARWRPIMTRWAALGVLAVLQATGLVVLALPGQTTPRALAAGGLAVGYLLAALAAARAAADRTTGLIFAAAAVGHAALGGLLSAVADRPDLAGPQLFTGTAAALAAAVLAAAAVGSAGPLFAAMCTAVLFGTGGTALCAYTPFTTTQAAAVVLAAATVVSPLVPLLAFRLARLRLSPLPTEPEHLQEDIDPEPSAVVLARAGAADQYMTGLHAGLALPAAVAFVLVAAASGWATTTLVLLVASVRLLVAHPMNSAWHRLAVAAPAVTGLVALTLDVAAGSQSWTRLAMPVVLVPVGSIALYLVARTMPGRRLMPYWGRIGDLCQTAATVAMFPVLLAVLGVYGYARGLGG